MSNALSTTSTPQSTNKEFYLKSIAGKNKGSVFRLTSNEIYVGRDPSNHISIPTDRSLSRKHARFILHNGKFYVQNLSARNFVKVNNEKVKQAELVNNSVVSIGEQSFKFIAAAANQQKTEKPKTTKKYHAQEQQKKILAVGAVVFLVLGYFYLNPDTSEKKLREREIATTEKIFEDIEKATIETNKLVDQRENSTKNSKEYKEAQKFYIKGFRDFQKGLYSSAMDSFETSLAMMPKHQLARRYSELSKNRLEELVAYNINEGKSHLENSKYNFCIASFQNAISQMRDKTDPRIQEAKVLLKKCKTLNRSKY